MKTNLLSIPDQQSNQDTIEMSSQPATMSSHDDESMLMMNDVTILAMEQFDPVRSGLEQFNPDRTGSELKVEHRSDVEEEVNLSMLDIFDTVEGKLGGTP